MQQGGGHRRGFAGGWFKCPRAVLHRILPWFGPQAASLLLILLEAREMGTLVARGISQEEIGRLLWLKERQVRNLTRRLEAKGLLTTIRRGRRPMEYVLSTDFNQILEKMGEEEPSEEMIRHIPSGGLFNRVASLTGNGLPVEGLEAGLTGNGLPVENSQPALQPAIQPAMDCRLKGPKDIWSETETETKPSSSTSLSDFDFMQNKARQAAYTLLPDHLQPTTAQYPGRSVDRAVVLQCLLRWLPSVDQELVEQHIHACAQQAPDVTAEDIVFFTDQKGPSLYQERPTDYGSVRELKPEIRSPGGFLRATQLNVSSGKPTRIIGAGKNNERRLVDE